MRNHKDQTVGANSKQTCVLEVMIFKACVLFFETREVCLHLSVSANVNMLKWVRWIKTQLASGQHKMKHCYKTLHVN